MLSTWYTKGIDYIHIKEYALPFDKLVIIHAGILVIYPPHPRFIRQLEKKRISIYRAHSRQIDTISLSWLVKWLMYAI